MISVNLEISCIRMGSGPALFELVRFYCIYIGVGHHPTNKNYLDWPRKHGNYHAVHVNDVVTDCSCALV